MNRFCKYLFVGVFMVCLLIQPNFVYAKKKETAEPVNHYEDTPKIANWNFAYSIESDQAVEELAQWDLIIADIHQESTSRKKLEKIRELNPDIIILAYISLADIRPDASKLQEGTARNYIGKQLEQNPNWILKRTNGTDAHWWEKFHIFNVTNDVPLNTEGERFNTFLPKFVRDAVIKDDIWDGVFYDNLWEGVSFVGADIDLNNDGITESKQEMDKKWQQGVKSILQQTQEYAKNERKDFVVTGNAGVGYYKHINGVGFEHFPTTVYGKWTQSMEKYHFIVSNGLPPQLAITNTNVKNSGKQNNYKKFRYGLTSTLLLDGYYSFDGGDRSHEERWYYDEYDAVIGRPISGAYNLMRKDDPITKRGGVWRRDFTNAVVLVNSTKKKKVLKLSTGFEKINGTQDTKVNSGQVVGQITIPKRDGIVLLRRLTQVTDATFINGAYANVYNEDGSKERRSFFASDATFPGNVQIHKVSETGHTVVADDTWVRVYNARNEKVSEFAPYGTDFHGGVQVDVGALYGNKTPYIVTGRRSGTPQVRIFELSGKVKHNGCFPFDKNFQGGVSVSIGDLNGDGRQEIVVAPAQKGSPQVRVLNNFCELIHPGFYAFPSNWQTGATVGVGDITGDGKSEIVVAPGPGGSPEVRIFNKDGKMIIPPFMAGSANDKDGLFLSVAHVAGRKEAQIVTYSFSIFNY